jgi:hypothetical protein
MRVDAMATPARPHALRRAFLTVLVESGLLSLALAALTVGQFTVAVVFGALAVAAFWLNVLVLLGRHRRTMVDRLTGTAMVRTALHGPSAATRPGEAGQAARPGEVGQAARPGEVGQAAARLTVDAAAAAGQLARERAEAIARSASVQQALNSRSGQRVRAFGGRASGSARRLGGRAQEIWEQRQSDRRLPPEGLGARIAVGGEAGRDPHRVEDQQGRADPGDHGAGGAPEHVADGLPDEEGGRDQHQDQHRDRATAGEGPVPPAGKNRHGSIVTRPPGG